MKRSRWMRLAQRSRVSELLKLDQEIRDIARRVDQRKKNPEAWAPMRLPKAVQHLARLRALFELASSASPPATLEAFERARRA